MAGESPFELLAFGFELDGGMDDLPVPDEILEELLGELLEEAFGAEVFAPVEFELCEVLEEEAGRNPVVEEKFFFLSSLSCCPRSWFLCSVCSLLPG